METHRKILTGALLTDSSTLDHLALWYKTQIIFVRHVHEHLAARRIEMKPKTARPKSANHGLLLEPDS